MVVGLGLTRNAEEHELTANETYIVGQVKRYIQIARQVARDEALGPVYSLPEHTLTVATMLQQENIFGNDEEAEES